MTTRQSQNTPIDQGLGAVGQQDFGNYAQQQKPGEDVNPVIIDATQASPPSEANGKKPRPEWQTRKYEMRRLQRTHRWRRSLWSSTKLLEKKVVKPKTAINVLNEMYPDIVFKIDEVAGNKTNIYRVHFEMDNKHHSGEGFSKSQAKQNACENALKTMLTEKLAKEQEAERIASEKTNAKRKIPTDDFPWGKLASFAMQKQMDSWTEAEKSTPVQSTLIGGGPRPFTPVVGGGVGPYGGHQTFGPSFSNYSAAGGGPPQPPVPATTVRSATQPCKKFPENPLEYNPVALCNQTWPNIEPTFDSSRNAEGVPVHTANLTLEGFRFSALGKSKKEVKLELSKAVISTLKGVKYPDGYTAQVMQA